MFHHATLLDAIGQAVWRASWQASALAVAVLAATVLLRGRLSPAWRYGLWSVVLVRLLLPLAPRAPWSAYALVEGWEGPAAADVITPAATDDPLPRLEAIGERPDTSPSRDTRSITLGAPGQRRPAVAPPPAWPMTIAAPRIAASVWLAGVVAMAIGLGCRARRLRRAAAAWPEAADRALPELMTDCQGRLGLRQPVRLCVAADGTGPAVLGAWRPRIVLPEVIVDGFARDQLEAILLHELAHIRRRDVAVHWLMIAARVFHWFNPIAWLALSRMAAERELTCDDVVIDILGESNRRLYGETMLRLLERLIARPAAPGVVHFFGSRRLRTRLESLTRTRKRDRGPKPMAITLLLGLAVFGLFDSVPSRATAPDRGAIETTRSAIDDARSGDEPAKAPAGIRLKGRVLDHRGEPVSGAEVVLLGGERLTVYGTPGNPNAAVRLSWSTGSPIRAPSVKTDARGRFTLSREGAAANRVAVICERVYLTEVPLDRIPDADDAAIELPEPGAIRIRCDIPRKPAKEEFQIALRTFDGADWKPDLVYLRRFDVTNPGESLIEALPPAQYIVERINHTDIGSRGGLATICERTLLPVASGRTTDVDFHRKVGRPVDGRVRGLEGVNLRYAYVSIGYLGPEEAPLPRGDRERILTHLDVIPIGPDGHFVTPPLPPGWYHFGLFALRMTTPQGERQQHSDFQGTADLTVPVGGAIPPLEIVAKPPRPAARPPAAPPPARDHAPGKIGDLEEELLRTLKKEHEFNDRRWPFLIKVRDVQDKTLIDATFKHRVSGKDDFDLVIQAKQVALRVDPGARVVYVDFGDAEIQHYRRDADVMLINDRVLVIPLPPDGGDDVRD
jgi:beta-lactamase regulating signal transducer with metallopeptidase domain